ncbi:hypothetical protein CN986_03900 [Bacillus thuringiensis]|nr:hypothetical protein CN986_03900 [Bacillus thuringiensis]
MGFPYAYYFHQVKLKWMLVPKKWILLVIRNMLYKLIGTILVITTPFIKEAELYGVVKMKNI